MPEVSRFLAAVFRAPQVAAFLDPRMLTWKYQPPRLGWPGPRSFVLRDHGNIVAHAGVWPVTVPTEAGEGRGVHLIDWAASAAAPGSGVLLLRRLLDVGDFLLTVGGSDATRAILPRIGYETRGDIECLARPLRPWKQLQAVPHRDWKSPARWARNVRWSRAPIAAVPTPWSAVEVSAFDARLDPVLSVQRLGAAVVPRRDVAMLDDMLACPGAKVRGFLVVRDETVEGCFVLSRVLGQTRLADLRLRSHDEADWRTAVALAVRCALDDPEAYEVAADASIPLIRQALVACGFQTRFRVPLFVLDPKGVVPAAVPLYLQMFDGDAGFLATPSAPFRT